MALIYYPSCKFTQYSPEISKKASAYLKEQYRAEIAGCCRPNHKKLDSSDKVIYICNTCAAICEESSEANELISVWELIDQDENFIFPDFKGKEITVQDCWRAKDRPAQHEAVRSLLKKMSFTVYETGNNREKSQYCGTSLLTAPIQNNIDLAPKRFKINAVNFFKNLSQQEQQVEMEAHCASLPTDLIACYCVPCTTGIDLGGKKGIHIMDLIFNPNII